MNTPPRKKKNSTKVNLIISAVFHTLVIGALVYFAAREGLLGQKLKTIAVQMAPKEKPPEKKPEPKKEEPKPEEEKPPEPKAQPKVVEVPKIAVAPVAPTMAAPPAVAPPAAAPPVANLGNFNFTDESAKTTQSTSDPVILYKGLVEYTLRAGWNRPDNVDDINYVAEVDLAIDTAGKITGFDWRKGSGDVKWDDSVKRALKQTATINRPPPKNFPAKVLVRFDAIPSTEPVPTF